MSNFSTNFFAQITPTLNKINYFSFSFPIFFSFFTFLFLSFIFFSFLFFLRSSHIQPMSHLPSFSLHLLAWLNGSFNLDLNICEWLCLITNIYLITVPKELFDLDTADWHNTKVYPDDCINTRRNFCIFPWILEIVMYSLQRSPWPAHTMWTSYDYYFLLEYLSFIYLRYFISKRVCK